MNSIYTILAPFYDALNGEVDYEAWADFYDEEIKRFAKGKTELILDLGCGTGNITLPLAARGYDMTGIDIVPEMLDMARMHAEREGYTDEILWLCQDMTEFELYGTVEAVVCCLDGINHLLSPSDVKKTFALVHNYLSPDGLFMFDINSPRKFKEVYGDRAYLFEDNGVVCAWQNCYREKSGLCEFGITLFEKEKNNLYRRYDEWQKERMYKPATIEKMLCDAGFEILGVYGDLERTPAAKDSMRIHYTARCLKP